MAVADSSPPRNVLARKLPLRTTPEHKLLPGTEFTVCSASPALMTSSAGLGASKPDPERPRPRLPPLRGREPSRMAPASGRRNASFSLSRDAEGLYARWEEPRSPALRDR